MRLNIPVIDEQHQGLFELIDELGQMDVSSTRKQKVGMMLSRLIEYAHHHFQTEEKLFIINRYPDMNEHIAEHDHYEFMLRMRWKDFNNIHDDDQEALSVLIETLNRYLLTWWGQHIADKDRLYVEYIHNTDIDEE
ncbi:bacteriohemerythrin [Dongshaea marina]|uniref:bacteriohemerythrin n=1 Tax=Dongshaea marina TaxID=2047966 RepID=UPI00131F16EE|nr:hemerythrin domain-containing protein [Dongshaea marina]